MKHDELPPDLRLLARQLHQAMDAQLKGELSGYRHRHGVPMRKETKQQYIRDIICQVQGTINGMVCKWEKQSTK